MASMALDDGDALTLAKPVFSNTLAAKRRSCCGGATEAPPPYLNSTAYVSGAEPLQHLIRTLPSLMLSWA